VSWNLPITEFTVIPAKTGIHLDQRVKDSGSPLCYGRNDGFFGHRAFFSSLLGRDGVGPARKELANRPDFREIIAEVG
jgi:hypothetical protein